MVGGKVVAEGGGGYKVWGLVRLLHKCPPKCLHAGNAKCVLSEEMSAAKHRLPACVCCLPGEEEEGERFSLQEATSTPCHACPTRVHVPTNEVLLSVVSAKTDVTTCKLTEVTITTTFPGSARGKVQVVAGKGESVCGSVHVRQNVKYIQAGRWGHGR